MARPHRIEVPQSYYHVHTRGNNREKIYFGNWSGRLFVRELERASRRHGWRIFAYCLMPNHYHVVLQIEECLSHGMCELNTRFSRITNRVRKRRDHLFGERFKSHLIEDDLYLLAATRYVLLNPVRSSLVDDAGRWRWSSLRATAGLELAPACLDSTRLLGYFGSTPARSSKGFRDFVAAGGRTATWVPGTDLEALRPTLPPRLRAAGGSRGRSGGPRGPG